MKREKGLRMARAGYIILGICFVFGFGAWMLACLFACGQLYDTYDLWMYMKDAPIAILISLGLLAGAVISFTIAIRYKKLPRARV